MKLDRLLAITMSLLNQKRITAADLAERFEVSLRTIYRDMETLNQAGIPIVSYQGTDGGYEIMPGYRLEKQFLTMEDIQSVIAALRGIQSAMDNDEVEYLVEKVGALVANQANQQQDPSVNLRYTPTYSEKEALGKLLQAIKLSCLVSFAYVDVNGAETERVVEPVGLFLKGYAWYLYAYCRTRSDFRIFRLSRMERLAITSTSFEKRNFTINDAEEKWESQLAPLTFRTVFIFSASVKSRVMDDFDPMEMETLPDGSIRVTTYYTGMDRALRHVLSYGCDARVMEPIALRTELRKQILKMVGFYT